MIFESLDFLDELPLEAYTKHFGTSYKPRNTSRTFRSNMMLNPLKLKHLNRIDCTEADMITLNLEDAIAPSRKKEALYNIALFVSHMQASDSFIIVRTNPLGEGGEEEIAFLNDFGFDAIRVAKVKNELEIARALTLLSPDKELHISLETKEAYQNLSRLRFDERLTVANLGILDLLTSLGLPQSIVKLGNPTIDYILSKFLVDAKTAGIHPISFMFQEYNDTNTFKAWCEHEKMMGFESKACMGPKQVDIANEVFGIDPADLKRAKHIKKVFESNAAHGENGFMDETYGFIDEPIYRDALLVLEQQREV
ncbi:aldolase/citrate lyase family protein [Sulfurovum sp. zt1-1]|uniref:Aldolase/citrate lyase family protein n=1 Tax=Sulfurovum zhangzhouensis TaxID=3019067 RepID=A0ABT7QW25_9BACT|nr:aldolase/citrate lyase family protein [Sulfurovum zhangzhouensis]MDM5270744.1 aldolase/citrate lyase family protein [Sulfurovum zhangzhouensis]